MERGAAHVLVVEDDRELARMLLRLLREEGFEATAAADGRRGLHLALTRPFAVLVLDRALPRLDGLSVLATLRRHGVWTPALVLSASDTVADRVAGLDAGAADYLGKPFDVEELLARLRALVRRSPAPRRTVRVRGDELDLDTAVLTDATGVAVALTDREAALLAVLAEQPGQVRGRSELRQRVFPAAETDNVIDTYVSALRRKLGRGIILTVYGVGFRLGT